MSTVTPRDLDPMPTSQSGSTQNELYAIGNDTNYRETNTRDIKNITGSGNLSETLTAPSEGVGEILIGRYGAGTGTATFNAPASVDILWPDGATTSSVVFEGNGVAVLTSVGADLYVKEYHDSGSNSNGEWEKQADGTLLMSGRRSETGVAVNISAAGGFRSGGTNFDTPYTMNDYTNQVANFNSESTTIIGGQIGTASNTQYQRLAWRVTTSASEDFTYTWNIRERWRS